MTMTPQHNLTNGKDTYSKSGGNKCTTVWETLTDEVSKKIYIKMKTNQYEVPYRVKIRLNAIVHAAGPCSRCGSDLR